MPVYIYLANKLPAEKTSVLTLSDGALWRIGAYQSVSMTDVNALKDRYLLVPSALEFGVPVAPGDGLIFDATDPDHPFIAVDETPPPWILVNSGAAPSPAFENGATALAGGFSPPSFRKLRSGKVELRGHIVCTSNTVFTMPVGYRPEAAEILPCGYASGSGLLIIYPNGSVGFNAAPTGFGTLAGSFYAA